MYALDILAWDLFFGLLMYFFAAQVFKKDRLEKNLKILLITSGILSLFVLIGVPLQNMQIRNIGIIGYTIVAPIAFLLMLKLPDALKKYKIEKTNVQQKWVLCKWGLRLYQSSVAT